MQGKRIFILILILGLAGRLSASSAEERGAAVFANAAAGTGRARVFI